MITSLIGYLARKLDNRPITKIYSDDAINQHHQRDEKINSPEKVSVIIPTRDRPDLLSKCIDSIRKLNEHNLEIIVVNNSSIEKGTLSLLEKYKSEDILVLDHPGDFNYSIICNLGAKYASGDYLCFLNNDTEVLSENSLANMVDHASQEESGVIGAVLSYQDGTIQHAGIALGYTGVAGHPFRRKQLPDNVSDNCFQVSAVTFACAVVSRSKFWKLGGLDPKFPSGFNDVDFSLRCSSVGLRNYVCVKAKLVHHESQTRRRSLSLGGMRQALIDVMVFLRKYPGRPKELFFSR